MFKRICFKAILFFLLCGLSVQLFPANLAEFIDPEIIEQEIEQETEEFLTKKQIIILFSVAFVVAGIAGYLLFRRARSEAVKREKVILKKKYDEEEDVIWGACRKLVEAGLEMVEDNELEVKKIKNASKRKLAEKDLELKSWKDYSSKLTEVVNMWLRFAVNMKGQPKAVRESFKRYADTPWIASHLV